MKLIITIVSLFIAFVTKAQTPEEKLNKEMGELRAQSMPLQKLAKEHTIANDTIAFNKVKAELFPIVKRMDSLENDFITRYTDADLSLELLFRKRNFIPENKLESYYNNLSEKLKQSENGMKIASKIKASKATALNQPAINFTQQDINGKPVSLSSFKGRYVLVDFWASWCVPCRKENPYLKAAYEKYRSRNFTILSFSVDTKEDAWKKAVAEDQLPWTQLIDMSGMRSETAIQYGISAIPMNFLINPDGFIIAKNLRGEALEAKLAELLQ